MYILFDKNILLSIQRLCYTDIYPINVFKTVFFSVTHH